MKKHGNMAAWTKTQRQIRKRVRRGIRRAEKQQSKEEWLSGLRQLS